MKKTKKDILKVMRKISEEASASLKMSKVSRLILKNAKDFLKADSAALFLVDEEKHLILVEAIGFKGNQLENLKILGSWEKINSEVVRKSKTLIVNDIKKSTAFKKENIPFSGEKLSIGAFLAVPLKKDGKIVGVLTVSHDKKRKKTFSSEDRTLLHTLANHVSIALLNARLYKDLKDLFLNTVGSLVTAIDARDPYTSGHSKRVSKYAVAIADELDCTDKVKEVIKLSGLLHDVGKIGVRDKILSKKGKLNEKELKKIRQHTIIGAHIVETIMDKIDIMKGIEEHHEKYDGTGYPKKLKGNKISLAGKIIAVADTFDTLTTNRPYQRALTAKEAFLEIARDSGKHFSPDIVKAFQRSFSKRPDFWLFK